MSRSRARRLPKRALAAVSVAALDAALAGCFGGLSSNAAPAQSYVLSPEPGSARAAEPAGTQAASVRVLYPTAAPGYDTDRILIIESDRRLDFYAASRWAASLPAMVEQLALQGLERSGRWSSVEDSRGAFPADYVLQIRIRRFDADYGASGAVPVVHVALDCWIGRSADRALNASFSVERAEPAEANRVGAVVAAFEHAVDAALVEASERAAAVSTRRGPSPP